MDVHVPTYIHTDGWTDGHLRPALLGQLCQRVDLKINPTIWHRKILGIGGHLAKLWARVWRHLFGHTVAMFFASPYINWIAVPQEL